MAITLQTAIRFFSKNPVAKSWAPRTNLKNAIVTYEREGLNGIKKIVSRNDGKKIVGRFNCLPDGQTFLTSSKISTKNGEICYSFGAQNYDKVIDLRTKFGDTLTRLAHTERPGHLDTLKKGGKYVQGNFQNEYNALYKFIMRG